MGRRLDIDIDTKDDLGIELDKRKGDHIIWTSDNDDFTIIFNHEGSPFSTDRFLIPKNQKVDSGLPINGEFGKSYRYSVYDGLIETGDNPPPAGSPKVRIKP